MEMCEEYAFALWEGGDLWAVGWGWGGSGSGKGRAKGIGVEEFIGPQRALDVSS